MAVQKLNQWCRLIDRRHLITFSFENIDITWHCDGTKKNIFITKINNFLLKLIFKKYPLNFFLSWISIFFYKYFKKYIQISLNTMITQNFFFFFNMIIVYDRRKKKVAGATYCSADIYCYREKRAIWLNKLLVELILLIN